MNDLLSLDTPAVPQVQHAASSNDLLNFGSVSKLEDLSFLVQTPVMY